MLINLRNALMSGKRKPTAKDYVQNGLVFMLDGIENAGWGIHNSTGGINLVTGTSVLFGATYSDDAIEMTTSSTALTMDTSAISSALLDSDGATLSLLGRDSSVMTSTATRNFVATSNSNILSFMGQRTTNGGGTWRSLMNWKGTTNAIAGSYHANQGTAPYVYKTTITYNRATRETKMYVNGVLEATITAGTYAWSSSFLSAMRLMANDFGTMNLSCYNRILTAAEIAANYAIDKARFGLP